MSVPDVNLSPSAGRTWAEGEWQHVERLAWSLLAIGLAILLVMALVSVQSSRALRNLEVRAALARDEALRAEDALAQREARLQEIALLLRRANQLERERVELTRRGPLFSEVLQAVLEALPPRVSVQAVEARGQQVVVEGEAGSPSLVVEFVRALEAKGVALRVVTDEVRRREALPSAVYFRLILEP